MNKESKVKAVLAVTTWVGGACGAIGAFCMLAALTASCDEEPRFPDKPTKEQTTAWVEAKVGVRHGGDGGALDDGAKLRWYVPYRPTPDAEAHGTTSEPARSFVFYERGGFCFLHDLAAQQRFLAPCDAAMPKGAATP